MNSSVLTLEILVFATGVKTIEEANSILEYLLLHEGVKQANFDLEDVDKVLRIVSCGIQEDEVERILLEQRTWCRVLN